MNMTAVRKKSLEVNKEGVNMFNYINSWKSRKSSQWNIEVRLGKITFLHLNYNKTKFRFILLNLGFEMGA